MRKSSPATFPDLKIRSRSLARRRHRPRHAHRFLGFLATPLEVRLDPGLDRRVHDLQ